MTKAMLNGETVLLISAILFCIGLLGLFKRNNLIRVVISIEVMFFASVINFCYFAGSQTIRFGHIAALTVVVLSGIVLSVIYAIFTNHLDNDISDDILSGSGDD